MTSSRRLLAVIPARGGSKGLPGKNLRPLAGVPLIAHSILFAKTCPQITRCVVSTEAADIAEVARTFGADVPFLRPPELAQDDTPLWPVLRHALVQLEQQEGTAFDVLLLLDPTSPGRDPSDLAGALRRLEEVPQADGIIGVSQPDFNPMWNCVVERDGWMAQLVEAGSRFDRRQQAPTIYRIHGGLYIWRSNFVRTHERSWREGAQYLVYETPESRSMSIDTAEEFNRAECLIKGGLITMPWLSEREARACVR